MEVELATIPLYLYSWFSLVDSDEKLLRDNVEVPKRTLPQALFKQITHQEMLHLALVANLLNAYRPSDQTYSIKDIAYNKVTYPYSLFGRGTPDETGSNQDDNFLLPLWKFDKDSIAKFTKVEMPSDEYKSVNSIANIPDFIETIADTIQLFTKRMAIRENLVTDKAIRQFNTLGAIYESIIKIIEVIDPADEKLLLGKNYRASLTLPNKDLTIVGKDQVSLGAGGFATTDYPIVNNHVAIEAINTILAQGEGSKQPLVAQLSVDGSASDYFVSTGVNQKDGREYYDFAIGNSARQTTELTHYTIFSLMEYLLKSTPSVNAEFDKGKNTHNVAPNPNSHKVNSLGEKIRDVFDVTYFIKIGFLNRLFNPTGLSDDTDKNTNQFFNAMVALEHIARYITAEVQVLNVDGKTTGQTSGPRFIAPDIEKYETPDSVRDLFKAALKELSANEIPSSLGFARKFRYDQMVKFLQTCVTEYENAKLKTPDNLLNTLLGSYSV